MKSTNGDTALTERQLGPAYRWLAYPPGFKTETGLDLTSRSHEMALQRLKNAEQEHAKIELSTPAQETEIEICRLSPLMQADRSTLFAS